MNGKRRMRRLRVVAGSESLISSAGGALLIETAAAVGLDQVLSEGLRPWRGRCAVHDPGKVLVDLAVAVALGGDCLADVAVVRAQPDLFADVASESTVSRLVAALAAVRQARAQARAGLAAEPAGRDRRADRGRPGRHDRAGALGEGRCHPDVETYVRVPPAAGVPSTPCTGQATF